MCTIFTRFLYIQSFEFLQGRKVVQERAKIQNPVEIVPIQVVLTFQDGAVY